ncbi:TPA: hypothetical protein ACQQHD_005657, partial [Pseudomonas aeruginosa]|uniref:hypothetical protein n=1 Tax=Pseudomonas aeruginosa TaxID=287 RepID=UPI002FE4A478
MDHLIFHRNHSPPGRYCAPQHNRVCRQVIRKPKSLKQHSSNYRSDRGIQMKTLKAILAISMF